MAHSIILSCRPLRSDKTWTHPLQLRLEPIQTSVYFKAPLIIVTATCGWGYVYMKAGLFVPVDVKVDVAII